MNESLLVNEATPVVCTTSAMFRRSDTRGEIEYQVINQSCLNARVVNLLRFSRVMHEKINSPVFVLWIKTIAMELNSQGLLNDQ